MSKQIETKFNGQVDFQHDIAAVWQFITEPEQVSDCTPGLTDWREIEPQKMYDLWFLWLTPAQTKLIFPTKLSWKLLDPPNKFCFSAITKPKAFGKIQIDGEIILSEKEKADTMLEFTAVVQTTNPFINQLIKNVLPKQIDQFFQCVKSKL